MQHLTSWILKIHLLLGAGFLLGVGLLLGAGLLLCAGQTVNPYTCSSRSLHLTWAIGPSYIQRSIFNFAKVSDSWQPKDGLWSNSKHSNYYQTTAMKLG